MIFTRTPKQLELYFKFKETVDIVALTWLRVRKSYRERKDMRQMSLLLQVVCI